MNGQDDINNNSFSSVPYDAHVFMISVAAELAGMHAQTLRTYDRMGLVSPQRTQGGGRRYSSKDVELLRLVQKLSQNDGVNLAGIKRIIELSNQVDALQLKVTELQNQLNNIVRHQKDSSALVVWQPHKGKRKRI